MDVSNTSHTVFRTALMIEWEALRLHPEAIIPLDDIDDSIKQPPIMEVEELPNTHDKIKQSSIMEVEELPNTQALEMNPNYQNFGTFDYQRKRKEELDAVRERAIAQRAITSLFLVPDASRNSIQKPPAPPQGLRICSFPYVLTFSETDTPRQIATDLSIQRRGIVALQSAARRHFVRHLLKKYCKAAVLVQSAARQWLGRRDYIIAYDSIVHCQSIVRRYLAKARQDKDDEPAHIKEMRREIAILQKRLKELDEAKKLRSLLRERRKAEIRKECQQRILEETTRKKNNLNKMQKEANTLIGYLSRENATMRWTMQDLGKKMVGLQAANKSLERTNAVVFRYHDELMDEHKKFRNVYRILRNSRMSHRSYKAKVRDSLMQGKLHGKSESRQKYLYRQSLSRVLDRILMDQSCDLELQTSLCQIIQSSQRDFDYELDIDTPLNLFPKVNEWDPLFAYITDDEGESLDGYDEEHFGWIDKKHTLSLASACIQLNVESHIRLANYSETDSGDSLSMSSAASFATISDSESSGVEGVKVFSILESFVNSMQSNTNAPVFLTKDGEDSLSRSSSSSDGSISDSESSTSTGIEEEWNSLPILSLNGKSDDSTTTSSSTSDASSESESINETHNLPNFILSRTDSPIPNFILSRTDSPIVSFNSSNENMADVLLDEHEETPAHALLEETENSEAAPLVHSNSDTADKVAVSSCLDEVKDETDEFFEETENEETLATSSDTDEAEAKTVLNEPAAVEEAEEEEIPVDIDSNVDPNEAQVNALLEEAENEETQDSSTSADESCFNESALNSDYAKNDESSTAGQSSITASLSAENDSNTNSVCDTEPSDSLAMARAVSSDTPKCESSAQAVLVDGDSEPSHPVATACAVSSDNSNAANNAEAANAEAVVVAVVVDESESCYKAKASAPQGQCEDFECTESMVEFAFEEDDKKQSHAPTDVVSNNATNGTSNESNNIWNDYPDAVAVTCEESFDTCTTAEMDTSNLTENDECGSNNTDCSISYHWQTDSVIKSERGIVELVATDVTNDHSKNMNLSDDNKSACDAMNQTAVGPNQEPLHPTSQRDLPTHPQSQQKVTQTGRKQSSLRSTTFSKKARPIPTAAHSRNLSRPVSHPSRQQNSSNISLPPVYNQRQPGQPRAMPAINAKSLKQFHTKIKSSGPPLIPHPLPPKIPVRGRDPSKLLRPKSPKKSNPEEGPFVFRARPAPKSMKAPPKIPVRSCKSSQLRASRPAIQ